MLGLFRIEVHRGAGQPPALSRATKRPKFPPEGTSLHPPRSPCARLVSRGPFSEGLNPAASQTK